MKPFTKAGVSDEMRRVEFERIFFFDMIESCVCGDGELLMIPSLPNRNERRRSVQRTEND